MKLLVDFDQNILIANVGNRQQLSMVEIKRTPTRTFAVQFLSDLTGYELDPAAGGVVASLKLTVKKHEDFAGPEVIGTSDFIKTGTGANTFYTCVPEISTVELNDLLIDGVISQIVANQAARYGLAGKPVGTIVRQTSDQSYWIVVDASHLGDAAGWSSDVPGKDFVDLDAELFWQVGTLMDASFTFTLRVWNNLNRLGDTLPTSAVSFPAAQYVPTVPANAEDFSMMPGGVAPATGLYLASAPDGKVWLYLGGRATWLYAEFGIPA